MYKLEKRVKVYSHVLRNKTFKDDFITCVKGHITIKKGFEYDGCSMSPDFKAALGACTVHDALYRYIKFNGTGIISRKDADRAFKEEMKEENFFFTNTYYYAVRIFGGIHNFFSKK